MVQAKLLVLVLVDSELEGTLALERYAFSDAPMQGGNVRRIIWCWWIN